jgi:hypothetical protein
MIVPASAYAPAHLQELAEEVIETLILQSESDQRDGMPACITSQAPAGYNVMTILPTC